MTYTHVYVCIIISLYIMYIACDVLITVCMAKTEICTPDLQEFNHHDKTSYVYHVYHQTDKTVRDIHSNRNISLIFRTYISRT